MFAETEIKQRLEEKIREENLICYNPSVFIRGDYDNQLIITFRVPTKLTITLLQKEYDEHKSSVVVELIHYSHSLDDIQSEQDTYFLDEEWEYNKKNKTYVRKTEGLVYTVEELQKEIVDYLEREIKSYKQTFEEFVGKETLEQIKKGNSVYRKSKFGIAMEMSLLMQREAPEVVKDAVNELINKAVKTIRAENCKIPITERSIVRDWDTHSTHIIFPKVK